jgi:hypothetical protein
VEADAVPATTPVTMQYVPGQQECGHIASGQQGAGDPACYMYSPITPDSSSVLEVTATPSVYASVSDLENEAVSDTLAEHDLPSSDASTVVVSDQPDVEANLWALFMRA